MPLLIILHSAYVPTASVVDPREIVSTLSQKKPAANDNIYFWDVIVHSDKEIQGVPTLIKDTLSLVTFIKGSGNLS